MRFTTFAATALFTALSAPLAFAADVMPANGMLVNASGMTVYVFDKDVADSGKSACSGGCLVAWPAVIATDAAPTAPYGSIKREDNGAMQLTYKGSLCTCTRKTRSRATWPATISRTCGTSSSHNKAAPP